MRGDLKEFYIHISKLVNIFVFCCIYTIEMRYDLELSDCLILLYVEILP